MEQIRVLIVDDEPLAREGIRMWLEQEPDFRVLGECGGGRQAVSAIQREAPDLVFLDVQMPKLDGFGVIETIGVKQMPWVIFVTAYDEYALRAFNVHALDYLLKPIEDERFAEALDRARQMIRGPGAAGLSEHLSSLLADLKAKEKYLTRLSIKTVKGGSAGGRILFLNVAEIDWIEAADNYVNIHVGSEEHLLHATMSSLEAKLDPRDFLRVHRSTIINLQRIRELHPLFQGEYHIVLQDGTQLTSSRSYRARLQQLLENNL